MIYQATATCPEGWKALPTSDSKCYLDYKWPDRKTFPEAKAQCESINAKLAEPLNEEENNAFTTAFKPFLQYWIGISDQEEEKAFRYASDGSDVAYFSWNDDKEQNKWPLHDCVAFKNGKWDTLHCTKQQRPFICQMDMEQCPPGTFGFPECDEGKFQTNSLKVRRI